MERVTLRIEKSNLETVDDLVDEGEYPNRSEAIRAAIRLLIRQHDAPVTVLPDGGEVVEEDRGGLDQEQIDLTASHLGESGIWCVSVLTALRELDDLEHGRGTVPERVRLVCQKCDDEIRDGESMGVAFSNIYHDECVPRVDVGPMARESFIRLLNDGASGPEVGR